MGLELFNVAPSDSELSCLGLRRTKSREHLYYEDGHPSRPKNWPTSKKSFILTVFLTLELYMTLIGTTGATAINYTGDVFFANATELLVSFTFTYFFGQAIGNLIIPPWTDAYGRRYTYIASAVVYSLACLVVALVPTLAGPIVGRFLSGFASSVPSCVIAGSISDLTEGNLQSLMIWIWNFISLVAQVLGPIYSAYISETLGWRWVYLTATAVSGTLGLIIIPLPETRLKCRLSQDVRKLSISTGDDSLKAYDPDEDTPMFQLLVRAGQLLFKEPIVIAMTAFVSYSFGLIYLFTAAFTPVYEGFGFSATQSTLPFGAILIGGLASPLLRWFDSNAVRRRQSQNLSVRPEDRLDGFMYSAIALAIGLWLWAWTIPPAVHVHWMVSLVGLALVGFATIENSFASVNYLVDSYTVYTASALAGCEFVRALVGAVVPLFAQPMFETLRYNAAGSVLAALATVFCVVPPLFIKYGGKMRQASPFAAYSKEVFDVAG